MVQNGEEHADDCEVENMTPVCVIGWRSELIVGDHDTARHQISK